MKKKKRSKSKWISVLLLAVLAVLLGLLLITRIQKPRPADTETPPSQTQSPAAAAPEAEAEAESEPEAGAEAEAEGEPEPDPEAGSVVISEYMVKNYATVQCADGGFYDWVELQNVSDHGVALEGWTLAEGGKSWPLPALELPAGERLLVFASGQDRAEGELHAAFSFSEGETLRLCSARGQLSDETVCFDPGADRACVRASGGSFTETLYPTPGFENSRSGYADWQSTLSAAGPLVIQEAAVKNYDFDFGGEEEEYPDWVEIRNISGAAVDLSGYTLSDSRKDLQKVSLPAGTLGPGETKLFLCTEDAAAYPGYSCVPLSLDSENDRLYLSSVERVIDALFLRDIPYGGSCGRMGDENGFFYFTEPTPGAPNAGGLRYRCGKPVLLTEQGVFEGVDGVTLELQAEGDIYYTLDGSLPTEESSRYSGPVLLTETCAVRAVCDDGQGLRSLPASFSFILNEGHTLPVLSVMCDDPKAFEEIYRRGLKGTELPGSISFFEEGSCFDIDCGVRMAGRSSLYYPKKNLTFRFRGVYGSSSLDYDLFGGGLASFTSLTIRAGTDSEKAVIRNELCQDLAAQFSDRYVNQRSRYCVVYVNGEYYGVYALKEKINRQFCADYAEVSKESVTMYNGPSISGEDFYDEVLYPILYQDVSDPEVYESVCRRLDIDSYIDWLIMEGYVGNRDILYGNLSYFRSPDYHENRWITIYFDLDATFRDGRYSFHNLHNLNYSLNQNSQMLRSLLKNESFRDAYLKRAAEALNGPLSNENVVATIERLYGQIDGEMERSCERWGFSYANYLSCREKLLTLIDDIDYYSNGIQVISEMAQLTEEERQFYFGS